MSRYLPVNFGRANRRNWKANLWRSYINTWLFFRASFIPLSFGRIGWDVWYKGDQVIWLWPWRRDGKGKWISLGFSGTGEFGDAKYSSLKKLDKDWEDYFEACQDEDGKYFDDIL